MRIIAYSSEQVDHEVKLLESTEEYIVSSNLSELFSFLCEPYENSIKICWNLDTTVSLLLRLFPVKILDKLKTENKAYLPPFEIFYIREKVFIITHMPSKSKCSLYGIEQYFPDLDEPEDIQELHVLGEKLLIELEKMGMKPTKLTSPVAIYEECIMRKLDLPKLEDIPMEAGELAYKCAGRLWIEAHKIGYFKTVYDYDMISAFPQVLQTLRDTRYCDWVQDDKPPKQAVYGYTEVDLTIYDWVKVHPILIETEDALLSPIVEQYPTELSKCKLDFIDTWKIGEYKIKNGWWAIPQRGMGEIPQPLYQPVKKLLSYKGQTFLQTLLAKRMSTGIWGKLGEEWAEEFGKYFNPCWFDEVSSMCTILVASWIYAHGMIDKVIQIGVDGILLTEPISQALGEKWKLAYVGEALVVSSGLVYTQTTRPKGLVLEDIKQMIKENPNSGYYRKGVKRRITLGDNISRDNPRLIGKEIEFYSSINLIGAEHDREFKKLPTTGKQLMSKVYDSKPIKL